MNKLWKRLVMLGMLVGCFATAAWAGNVEVDWKEGSTYASVTYEADGFYQTGSYYINPTSGEKYYDTTYQTCFDSKGNMILWMFFNNMPTKYHIERNEYDENGNLVKHIENVETVDSERQEITTYSYDEKGRISEVLKNKIKGNSQFGNTATVRYEYSDHQVKVTEERNYDTNTVTYEYVYTLDDNENVVKCVTSYNGKQSSEYFYTYDENGNLTKMSSDFGSTEYTYNDQNLCIKSENSSGYTQTYTYDENGNVIESDNYHDSYAQIPQNGSQSSFHDVASTAYYNAPVIWATVTGITNGKTTTTFVPNQGCTRAQMVTFLWRAAGSPEPESNNNPFEDVNENSPYYKAILWAVEQKITNGKTNTTFAPNDTCTRAQIVTFIYRAAGEPSVDGLDNPFEDVKEGNYYNAILWAVENGITNGFNATTFKPEATCTRAQGVTFLYRGMSYINIAGLGRINLK